MRICKVCVVVAAVLAAALMAGPAWAGPITSSNGYYEVHVSSGGDGDFSIGSWNAITGALHPTGGGNDLLYSGTTVATNYSSLRVYGALGTRDYVFGSRPIGADLDPSYISEGASAFGAGTQTTWGVTAEGLRIVQDVFVVGTAFGNSAVYHTVEITNTGGEDRSIGWRNLYDWAVNDPGFDDGPNNSIESVGAGVQVAPTTFEFGYTPGTDDYARVSVDPGVATYEPLLGLGFDPNLSALATTAPEYYAYVGWSSALPWGYVPFGGSDVTGDSAGLSYWGRTAGTAHLLLPGQSVRFTQTIYGVLPDEPPPGIPEPGTLALLGLGLAGAYVVRRRRRLS